MTFALNSVRLAAFLVVIACWLIFIFVLVLRKKTVAPSKTRRIAASRWGFVLQGLSYALIWSLPRRQVSLLPRFTWLEVVLAGFAATTAIASVWLWLWVLRALGHHWALMARVVEGHRLVTEGPYRLVRNPIYLSMFGMLVATGLVVTSWWVLPLAAGVFLAVNAIRIRAEEKLLRVSFGLKFDDYAFRVPAMFLAYNIPLPCFLLAPVDTLLSTDSEPLNWTPTQG